MEPKGRLARWVMELQEFQFSIEHRPGRRHANADALSRLVATASHTATTHAASTQTTQPESKRHLDFNLVSSVQKAHRVLTTLNLSLYYATLTVILFVLSLVKAGGSISRFHICFIFQEILVGRAFLFLTIFSPLHPRTQGALHNFYMQSRPHCTGNRTLAKTFLQRRKSSLVEQFLYLRHSGEVYKLTLQSNQTVYIYIDQFIAIKVNSWVFHSL